MCWGPGGQQQHGPSQEGLKQKNPLAVYYVNLYLNTSSTHIYNVCYIMLFLICIYTILYT